MKPASRWSSYPAEPRHQQKFMGPAVVDEDDHVMLHFLSMDVHKKSHPDNAMPYARNLASSNPVWPEAYTSTNHDVCRCPPMSKMQIKRSTRTKQLKIVMQLEGCALEVIPIPCSIPSCRGPVECALEWCAEKEVTCRHFSTFAEAFQLADPYPGATPQLETNRCCNT